MAYLQGFGPEGDHLRGRFSTQWNDRTEIAWGNINFTPPNDAAWVRFNVRHAGADRMNPGTDPIRRHDGMVVIEVFVPQNQGEGALDDHCDTAAAVFRDHTSQQGLRMRSPYTTNVGATDGWFKKDVLVPFTRDTVFT